MMANISDGRLAHLEERSIELTKARAEIEQLQGDLESVTDERDRLRKLAHDYIEAYERGNLLPPMCIVDVWKEALQTKDSGEERGNEVGDRLIAEAVGDAPIRPLTDKNNEN